jgi:hypothetical protein
MNNQDFTYNGQFIPKDTVVILNTVRFTIQDRLAEVHDRSPVYHTSQCQTLS